MRKFSTWTLLLAAPFVIGSFGCGGSGGGGGSSSSGGGGTKSNVFLKDAAPVPIQLNGQTVFTMSELWLEIDRAEFEDVNGNSVPITLNVTAPATTVLVDVMTLGSTSQFFGFANIPAGTYKEITLHVMSATMVGTPATPGPTTIQLQIASSNFEAEFTPNVVFDPANPVTFVIDWTPAVRAQGSLGSITYVLDDDVDAFVLGGGGSSPTSVPVNGVEGDILTLDCANGTMTIKDDHHAAFQVVLDPTTQYFDDNGASLGVGATGCAALGVGDEVKVNGTVLSSGAIQAAAVTDDDAGNGGGGGGGGGGNGSTDVEGFVQNLAQTASGIEFDVIRSNALLAHVATDAGTSFEFDNGGATTAASVQNGLVVEAEGNIDPQTHALVADEVEIQ